MHLISLKVEKLQDALKELKHYDLKVHLTLVKVEADLEVEALSEDEDDHELHLYKSFLNR